MPKPEIPNPYVEKTEKGLTITKEGWERLEDLVTDTKGQVYVFTKNISPVIAAAAMARLSRRAGDMRLTVLDEFAIVGDDSQAEKLIERVVTGYGDDSVQQLITIQFVVEEASNLLTKLLEWGRFGSYLEQSTRYIYFDEKGSDGKYLYYTPKMSQVLTKKYNQTMDTIFDEYSAMVHELTTHLRTKYPEPTDKKERTAWINSTRATACDAVRSILPAATKSTVGIVGSTQAVESLIVHLLSEPLEEAQRVGHDILREARKIVPSFLKRADMPERGGAATAYRAANREAMRTLASSSLQKSKNNPVSGAQLVSHWPKQELDLVSSLLFEAGDLPMDEIQKQVSTWNDTKKEEVYRAYAGHRLNRRHRPGRAFEASHFEWEVIGDYGTFRDLQRHRVVDAFEWQRLHPYFGYDIPDLVTEIGCADRMKKCFDLAETLYQDMVTGGEEVAAQYATLFGHKMRYRFITNLRELFHFIELRTGPDGHPGYRKICNQMYDLFAEKYPIAADIMSFVNQRENPELTRQAAELATQYKLENLGALED